jgi:hypothetical protein
MTEGPKGRSLGSCVDRAWSWSRRRPSNGGYACVVLATCACVVRQVCIQERTSACSRTRGKEVGLVPCKRKQHGVCVNHVMRLTMTVSARNQTCRGGSTKAWQTSKAEV